MWRARDREDLSAQKTSGPAALVYCAVNGEQQQHCISAR